MREVFKARRKADVGDALAGAQHHAGGVLEPRVREVLRKVYAEPLLERVGKVLGADRQPFCRQRERQLLAKALVDQPQGGKGNAFDARLAVGEDLSSVAEQVGIHPVSLSRMFCARTGIGFMKFLKYLRASAATNLMQKSDMTFAEIAYAVGFGSIRSFNRTFMEIYSITPTEYRESLKKFNP